MKSTTITTDAAVLKTARLAGAAVAAYAADHELEYCGLDLPTHRTDEPAITLRVHGPAVAVWLEHIAATVEPETRRPAELSTGRELVIHRGTLPCPLGDVAVALWTSRKFVPLRLVGAES